MVADVPTGPKDATSTVLSLEDEAIVVAFRGHTLLALDNCLYALQATIPHLTRSSLHRCLQRYGISRLPEVDGDKPGRRKFKAYAIGYFHIDIAEVRTAEGKLHLFVAIDRTTKFAFVQLHEKATTRVAGDFLRALIATVPYRIHTVLTDNGIHFTDSRSPGSAVFAIKQAIEAGKVFRAHAFEYACARNDIDHRADQAEASLEQRPVVRRRAEPPRTKHPYPSRRPFSRASRPRYSGGAGGCQGRAAMVAEAGRIVLREQSRNAAITCCLR